MDFRVMTARIHKIACLSLAALAAFAFSSAQAAEDAEKKAKQPGKFTELPAPVEREVDFVADVRPILQRSCFSCHGGEAQEGGLRLHRRQDALSGGDSGPAWVKGKSAESRLIQFVTGLNEEGTIMPPDGQPLSAEEVGILRKWIDLGAPWPDSAAGEIVKSDHWAFQPVQNPQLPPVTKQGWVKNPIDQFVLAKLESLGLAPAPQADKATLLRRVSLDLTGLLPSPEEVEKFLADDSPDAYANAVDRLLESDNYGERWARHWLDLARYADSDGYEKDSVRPHAWRYRNWVINAFNRDLPFDQFTIDQLAGDLLPEPNIAQLVATGFHRNTLTNREGGVDREEDRVKQTVDRTNTTGTVWLGLTVGCAQCHSHKYDPISQRDYYQLYAFFNSLQEKDIPAPVTGDDSDYQEQKKKFDTEHAKLQQQLAKFEKEELPGRLAAWEAKLDPAAAPAWQVLTPGKVTSAAGATLAVQKDGSVLASGKNPDSETYTIEADVELGRITALKIEALSDASLPAKGPGRVAHGNFVLSEVTVKAGLGGKAAFLEPQTVNLAAARADYEQPGSRNKAGWPATGVIDGKPETGWAVAKEFGKDHALVIDFEKAIESDGPTRLVITLSQEYGTQHTLGKFRLSVTGAQTPVPLQLMPQPVVAALQVPAEKRNAAQQQLLLDHYRQIDSQALALAKQVADHAKAEPKRKDNSMAQTLADLPAPRTTHILVRGDFLRPGTEVQPTTPEVLPGLPGSEEMADRLDLARWIVSPENPLTSRVTVNRFWQRLFGQGLVSTSHDFGTQGEEPTHPELLDWLAADFMSHGWSMKHLIRTIVTSATYQQSARTRPELMEDDPYNKLLARQNRRRVEAEIVRDVALDAAGLLHNQIGGPSVRPPQPDGIASLGYANSVKWQTSAGPDRYRRGLYTFFQRTVPYPMLMDFDAPDSNVTCTRRESSNTPLSALTLQNDPVFVECAQGFARRIGKYLSAKDAAVSNATGSVDDAVRRSFLIFLGREPEESELAAVASLYDEGVKFALANPKAAAEMIGAQAKPEGISDAQLAGWTLVGRTLMNTDEFITRD